MHSWGNREGPFLISHNRCSVSAGVSWLQKEVYYGILLGSHGYLSGVKVKTVKLIGGGRFKVNNWYHYTTIHSDHGYRDTWEIPPRTILRKYNNPTNNMDFN